MNSHVLIVDDDNRIRDLLSKYLSKNGFITSTAASTNEACNLMKKYIFDLLVVDYMMPDENGIEFVKKLRNNNPNEMIPIIMLTALNEVENRIEGLTAGVDDYLSKPFEPKELVLRMNNLLKRSGRTGDDTRLTFGSYEFDFNRRTLTKSGDPVKLTKMEGDILMILLKNVNKTMSREEICSLYSDINERTIDVQITRIRKKIEDDIKNPRYLKTIRNNGYVFVL